MRFIHIYHVTAVVELPVAFKTNPNSKEKNQEEMLQSASFKWTNWMKLNPIKA